MQRAWAIGIASALLLAGCAKKEEKEAEAVAPVQVTVAQRATIHRIVEADGVLYPVDQAAVMPKISAPVHKFFTNRGDHVTQGQLLATLENRDLVAAVAAAKAQVQQAQSNLASTSGATVPEALVKARTDVQAAQQQLDAAQKLLESRRGLFEQGALARRQVDEAQVQQAQAKAQLDSALEHLRTMQSVSGQEQIKGAQAQVEAAQAQYQNAEAQLSYSEVRSPISGVVADRPTYPGEMATAGTALLTVMDTTRIVARVNVPQKDAASVKPGDPASIKLTDGVEMHGTVKVVSPATDPSSTTVQVWAQADNPGERQKPGASAHVSIVVATIRDATVAPAAALVPGEDSGSSVMVVKSDNTAERRKVETGVREGDMVQILSGVSPGDQVITVGALGLDDKAKVRIVKAGEKEKDEEEGKK